MRTCRSNLEADAHKHQRSCLCPSTLRTEDMRVNQVMWPNCGHFPAPTDIPQTPLIASDGSGSRYLQSFSCSNRYTTDAIDCIRRKWQQVFARRRCNVVCDLIICWDTCTLGSIRIAVCIGARALGAGSKSLTVDGGVYVHAVCNICMASRK